MEIRLPLKEMTLADKLQAMEAIWADLSAEGSGYEPPEWHGAILEERKEQYAKGELSTSDWEEAKKRIRDSV
ncbi:MAG: addiction module protein [Coraliomargarita sp.]